MRFFSVNKNQAAVITTILILALLGAGYFFIYLPQNEKRIQEQRFNTLQNIDRNIHAKIENSVALLNTLLDEYKKTGGVANKKLKDYINTYPSTNFILTIPDTVSRFTRSLSKDSIDTDSAYSIKVDNNTREISLFFLKQETKETKNKTLDTTVYKIGMKFSFKQFIQPLLPPKDVFDDYIVFSKGKSVYETFPSGISYVKEDTLLGAKNGFGGSGLRNQVISGTDYKLFLQPVGFDAKNEWVICGLVSGKHYQNEKTQLPTAIILLLVTIMLIGLVAFPWLKLYQMGSKDRLTVLDGIASIFISMILLSLIFFLFFKYNYPFRPPGTKDDPKVILANGINNAFKNEINTVYHKLKQFDSLVEPGKGDIINLRKDSIDYATGKDTVKHAKYIQNIIGETNINFVFWIDKNGEEIINWTKDNINAPHGNFKAREYFKGIIEQQQYHVNDKDTTSGFFLDQGISWTTGSFRSAISLKSRLSTQDSPVVAAISFNFRSLDTVILPTGYLFAITDNSGKVLYHSDPSRNLNENLLNVFSKRNELKSCLDAKAPGTFSTKYWGKEYQVEVKPVNGLPYSIIIFEDAVYNETREMEIYSFTFSMLFLFFGFLVLQLSAIFLVSSRRSFFKKQYFDTSWIGPKKSSQEEYVLASVFNGTILFLLILFFNNSSFLCYLFMLLYSVTIIPLFLNFIFYKKYKKEGRNVFQYKKWTIYCLCVFIVVIDVAAYKMLDPGNFISLLGYEILVVCLGGGSYTIKSVIDGAARKLKKSKRSKVLFGNWTYVNSFALMALTRLIITSGLPVVFFYIASHDYEQNLSIRYKQIDFANRLVNKFPGSTNERYGVYIDSSLVNKDSIISDSTIVGDSSKNADAGEAQRTIELLKLFRLYTTDKAIREDKLYSRGAADSSFFFNHLLKDACTKAEGTITYRRSSFPDKYLMIQSENLNYQFPSVFKTNWFNAALFWLLLAAMLFAFYFIIFNIIKKLFSLNLPALEIWKGLDDKILVSKESKRPLFVIGVPGAGKLEYIKNKIRNKEIIVDNKTSLCFDNKDKKKNNVIVAELINIPSSGNEDAEKEKWNEYIKEVFDEKNRMIIVNHFEYNIQDPVSNSYKLDFLERLYLENTCKIIILSTIHPVAFLDSAMDFSLKTQEKPAKAEDKSVKAEERSVPGQDLERWHVLLGHYRLIIFPLQLHSGLSVQNPMKGSVIDNDNHKGIADVVVMIDGTRIKTFTIQDGQFILQQHPLPFVIVISLEGYSTREIHIHKYNDLNKIKLERGPSYMSAQLIRQETNQTYFLKNIQEPAFRAGKDLPEDIRRANFDELAFKLQVSSHYFYMYIWQSLTKEEKFLLYDLAEDNLVNSFDDYNLSMLIAKGVVIRPDGTLRLFSKGFRNFILTAIGNSEAMKIKNQIKDNGNWNTLKNPLQLVVLAILAFLLSSQEEAFSKLITYVAALGAGVPTVLRLFTLFTKNPQKPA